MEVGYTSENIVPAIIIFVIGVVLLLISKRMKK